jgi:hypothetical protein
MTKKPDLVECFCCGEEFDANVEGGVFHGDPMCDYCAMCEDDMDDDNFDDNDRELSYARLLQRSGVECQCDYCGRKFTGMPDHGVCSSCADKIEAGWDLEPFDSEKAEYEKPIVIPAEEFTFKSTRTGERT